MTLCTCEQVCKYVTQTETETNMEENLNIQPDTAPEAAAVNTETKKKSSKPALFLKKIWNFIKEKRSYFIAFLSLPFSFSEHMPHSVFTPSAICPCWCLT